MPDARRIVFLSDPHIAADPATVDRGANMAERLRAVVDDILRLKPFPMRIICNGDQAHDTGEVADYEQLRSIMQPLWDLPGGPVCYTLGNHDNWRHFPCYRVHLMNPFYRVVPLNTLRITGNVEGWVGTSQLEYLRQVLVQPPPAGVPTLIAMHHPPLPDPEAGVQHNLQDYEAFWDVVAPHRHVKAVFFGHLHRYEHTLRPDGIHLVGLPPTSFVFREGDPWGYVIGDLRPDGIDLTLRAFDGHARDGEILRLNWR